MSTTAFIIFMAQLGLFAFVTSPLLFSYLATRFDGILKQAGLPLPGDSGFFWTLTPRGCRGLQYATYIIFRSAKRFSWGKRSVDSVCDFDFRAHANRFDVFLSFFHYLNMITCGIWVIPYAIIKLHS